MTSNLLRMFRGKSLLKMALFLKKKCQINFNSGIFEPGFEKIFYHPDLNLIKIDPGKTAKPKETQKNNESEMRFLNRLKNEENKLKTRISFENEKLKNLLLKKDDILELQILTNQMKSLKERHDKSNLRHFFKEILWKLNIQLCVSFDGKQKNFLKIQKICNCECPSFVEYSFRGDGQSSRSDSKRKTSFHKTKPPNDNKILINDLFTPLGKIPIK